jgi:hypothetical protein
VGITPNSNLDESSKTQRQENSVKLKMPGTPAPPITEAPAWMVRAKPSGIARVPTHAVRPVSERRSYMRAKLSLSMRLKRIAGKRTGGYANLRTTNISSSGVLFLCPMRIEPETPVELEVCVLDRPYGRGSVHMITEAHVVRADASSQQPGWFSLAATFDDITFHRDEPSPSRMEEV